MLLGSISQQGATEGSHSPAAHIPSIHSQAIPSLTLCLPHGLKGFSEVFSPLPPSPPPGSIFWATHKILLQGSPATAQLIPGWNSEGPRATPAAPGKRLCSTHAQGLPEHHGGVVRADEPKLCQAQQQWDGKTLMSHRAAGAQVLQENAICEVISNQDLLGGAMQKTRRGFPWLLLLSGFPPPNTPRDGFAKTCSANFLFFTALPTAQLCIVFSAVLCVAIQHRISTSC